MSIERIDPERCNGCGICVNTCPMDCIRLDTYVTERNEHPDCRLACPAGADMRTYINLLKNGMVFEAMNVIRESLPLPAVTGRICRSPCESACARNDVDDAVNIKSLERYVADYWMDEKAAPVRQIYGSKVAIVGSGPAGLSSAYFLALRGYPVTVFEAMPALGGMLRYGVPEFRLPGVVLDAQIQFIQDLGVTFKTNTTIGEDKSLEDLKSDGYDAILLTLGAQLSKKVSLEGSEMEGVLWGLEFLKEVDPTRQSPVKDKRVCVVGGGNVALSVALSVARLGAKDVQIACLESRERMPACEEDVLQAEAESIPINTSWGVKRVLGENSRVTGVEFRKCVQLYEEQSVFDPEYVKGGIFNPIFDEANMKTIEADVVILAVGQTSDLSLVPESIETAENDTIQADPVTFETSVPGVFACGDVTTGPGLAIGAIAGGKESAVSIDRYLKGQDLRAGRTANPSHVLNPPKEQIVSQARHEEPLLSLEERVGNFKEVKLGLDEHRMGREARRCMTCGGRAVVRYAEDCMLCLYCERDCPQNAIYVSPEKMAEPIIGWR